LDTTSVEDEFLNGFVVPRKRLLHFG